MTKEVKTAAAVIAMKALRGYLTPIPEWVGPAAVLDMMPSIGGIRLEDAPGTIVENATRFAENFRVSHIVVNVVMGDTHITLLLEDPKDPYTEERILDADGCFSYVYNATCTWCSELGYTFYERKKDREIHRIG